MFFFFFFQAEDGIRDLYVTGVQTCALPISCCRPPGRPPGSSCTARWSRPARTTRSAPRGSASAPRSAVPPPSSTRCSTRCTGPVSATSTCRCCRTGCGRRSPTIATFPARRPCSPAMTDVTQPMDGWGVLERAAELRRRGQEFALATVVWRQGPSSGQQGSRAIITADGELHGWNGGACAAPVVLREARQVITEGVPRLLLLGSPAQFGAAVKI